MPATKTPLRDVRLLLRITPELDAFLDQQANAWGLNKATLAAYAVSQWCVDQKRRVEALRLGAQAGADAMREIMPGVMREYVKALEQVELFEEQGEVFPNEHEPGSKPG